jgi:dipeptidyl aminopeptidase/acylaminoacyl peptidase
MDSTLNPDFQRLSQLSEKGTFKIIDRDLKDQYWIIASLSDQRPAHFYLYDRSNKKTDFLFSTQPELEQYDLSPMQPISFKARDGMKLFGYLTLPIDQEVHHLPTVLLVHGGPWVQDTWGLQPAVQWLANRGYAVLQINYRGSTGYGKEYLNAGNREWAGKMHTDLLDGKQWMIDQGYADPNRIAIYGGSYGGYATLVGLAFTPDEFCCGIDIVGPSNLVTLMETIPPYWAPLKTQMDRMVGSLNDLEFLKERSPLYRASQITKPLLIAQGAHDPRVKQSESDQIVAEMRKNQLPVEYLLFSDEGHGFARPQNRLKFFSAAEEFLAKYLGGRYQSASEEENWHSLQK